MTFFFKNCFVLSCFLFFFFEIAFLSCPRTPFSEKAAFQCIGYLPVCLPNVGIIKVCVTTVLHYNFLYHRISQMQNPTIYRESLFCLSCIVENDLLFIDIINTVSNYRSIFFTNAESKTELSITTHCIL